MHKFFETIVRKRSNGTLVPAFGATCSIYTAESSSLATLYEDDGVTTKTNPLTADANGFVGCKLTDGIYDLVFSDGVVNSRVDGYVAIGGVMA